MQFYLSLLFFYLPFFQLIACTGIMLNTKDGQFVHGRTLEFSIELNPSLTVVPRGYSFKGASLNYESKYGVLGVTAFDNPAILDGINEKGFSMGTFFFPGFASYAKNEGQNGLSPADFPNWALTQFASIDELKAALRSVRIVAAPVKGWGDEPPPFHYIAYDKKGNCLVIEPVNGEAISYDNPLGTLTNSPDFPWHMTNLRNYINMTAINAKPFTFRGIEFKGFGQGSGMVGLPGDFTPPSRFVRATIFTAAATPANTTQEAILQTFHILNQFDIPVGAIRQETGGKVYTDYTMVTVARDPESLKYYFRTYEDSTIKVADLNKLYLNGKQLKTLNMDGKEVPVDITGSIK